MASLLEDLRRRVAMALARCVVAAVNDGAKLQGLQIKLLAGEAKDGVERFQQYGLTAHPHPGAEGVAVFVGGNRDHGLVLAVDDRRYRLRGLAQGEVALYDDQGQKVHLTRDGIVIEAKALTVNADGDITLAAGGDVTITGSNINLN